MSSSAIHHAYWHESVDLDAPEPGERFSGTADAEVAVIGGGVAGLVTALNLARLGHVPLLLEAATVASAATGTSAGIVAPQLVRNSPASVRSKLGAEAGDRLLAMLAQSGDYLFELARELPLDCEARQDGFIAPAMGRSGFSRLRAAAEGWRPYRSDMDMLCAAETQEMTGTHGYAGALLDRSGGTVNPLLYGRALAHAAIAAGVQLHTASTALRLSRHNDCWMIETATGSIRARTVILCANAANGDLHPALRGTTLPLEVCEVATAPLDPALRSRILPGGQSLTDVEADVFSIRHHAGGGLVTAYPAGSEVDDATVTRAINARLSAAIPSWKPLPLTHIWRGTAAVNSSLLPRLVRVEDGLIAVQACNGRGLAMNTILGRELARWLHAPGATPPPLPLEKPSRISGFLLARHAPKLIMTAALLGKRLQQFVAGPRKTAQEKE